MCARPRIAKEFHFVEQPAAAKRVAVAHCPREEAATTKNPQTSSSLLQHTPQSDVVVVLHVHGENVSGGGGATPHRV